MWVLDIILSIVESILSVFAEKYAGRAIEKARAKAKNPKLMGWINLAVLIVIIVGMTVFGIYLCVSGVVWIGIFLFAIAALILVITVLAAVGGVKKCMRNTLENTQKTGD